MSENEIALTIQFLGRTQIQGSESMGMLRILQILQNASRAGSEGKKIEMKGDEGGKPKNS